MNRKRGLVSVLKGSISWRMLIAVSCLVLALDPPLAAEEQQAADHPPTAEIARTDDGAPLNSLDQAIDLARQKITADPASLKDQVALGYLLLKKGSLEEAGMVFDAALSQNDRYHDALTGKGIVLARTGKDLEAEETLQKALILNPNPIRTYFELGSLYETKGDFARAIIEYKNGIEKYKQGRE